MIDANTPPRPQVRDAMFAMEVLRRLDVDPDHIYFNVTPIKGTADKIAVQVVVRKPGVPDWAWDIGDVEVTGHPNGAAAARAVVTEWQEAVRFWNTCPPHTGLWGFMESAILARGVTAALSLHAKGTHKNAIGHSQDEIDKMLSRPPGRH